MSTQQADLVFEDLAESYVQYRPVPPPSLISVVVDYVKQGRGDDLVLCGDVGCGSGQNTFLYSNHFRQVVGVDVSVQQMAQAHTHANSVTFRKGSAEQLPFPDASVALLTCCASVHWFDFKPFYAEVDRVLKPGGALATYGYHGCTPLYNNTSLRELFLQFWRELDKYWTDGHQHLWAEYTDLPQLYPDDVQIKTSEGRFSTETDVTLDIILGYISSWSAFSKLTQAEGKEAAAAFLHNCKQRLLKAMGTQDENVPMRRRYDYFLRMWRKPAPSESLYK